MKRALLTLLAVAFTALSAQAKTGWKDDYEKALAEAKSGDKLVLLDFTGSDWCSWCMKMDKEVFEQKAFKDYAKDKLVLVEVDFPNAKHQTNKLKKQNVELKEKFKVSGFPSLVVVNGEGKVVKQFGGYQAGGPEKFVAALQEIKK